MRSPVLEGQRAQGERYILDDQVGFLLRQAQQRHTTIFAAEMIESLTPTQWAALAKLREVGDCSQNHLGRLTAMDAATIKGLSIASPGVASRRSVQIRAMVAARRRADAVLGSALYDRAAPDRCADHGKDARAAGALRRAFDVGRLATADGLIRGR